jgi:hypothetical protein
VFTRHVSKDLLPYCDGELTEAAARAVERHLARCVRCRAERDTVLFASTMMRRLPTASAPPSLWPAIQSELSAPPSNAGILSWGRIAAAMATLVIVVAGAWWSTSNQVDTPWEVAVVDGAVRSDRLAAGAWVETAASSRARITVGDIGTVDVEPGSRVQLGHVLPMEYRVALRRGTIHARITAPPRVFIVDTPASTLVDLGCAYTVTVDDDGAGLLRVSEGWAALEWKSRESVVPAGARCRIAAGAGPGTPYFEDASAALQSAVVTFDEDGDPPSLTLILAEARIRDTLTLWHLLARVGPDDRERVYDRMAALAPPPPSVSREKALQLDRETLIQWRDELAWTW